MHLFLSSLVAILILHTATSAPLSTQELVAQLNEVAEKQQFDNPAEIQRALNVLANLQQSPQPLYDDGSLQYQNLAKAQFFGHLAKFLFGR